MGRQRGRSVQAPSGSIGKRRNALETRSALEASPGGLEILDAIDVVELGGIGGHDEADASDTP